MKHDIKVTLVLLIMFFISHMIGLVVINAYSPPTREIIRGDAIMVEETGGKNLTMPYDMQPPKLEKGGLWVVLLSIFSAILIATLLFLLLTKLKASFLIRAWFFFVVLITMSISLTALLSLANPSWDRVLTTGLGYPLTLVSIIALAISAVFAFYKIVKRNFIAHNFSELFIYPGLAAVFVPWLYGVSENVAIKMAGVIGLLVAISFYDMYAVWKSKFMIKLAKYQIQNLKVFAGFFLPYLDKDELKRMKAAKAKALSKGKKPKPQKVKIGLAILGGGDVAFTLIFAGVVLRAYSFLSAFIVSFCVTIALLLLFVLAKKEKVYPAMPFLTAGCIVGYLISLLVNLIIL